ncbi:hypothetical protein [Novosphingobium sp. BL-8A]|uniref:hypothetical protein n=1 Tax=Novosphingobium sp. BL-8A TaxID=3127639 RepID=UPI003758436B
MTPATANIANVENPCTVSRDTAKTNTAGTLPSPLPTLERLSPYLVQHLKLANPGDASIEISGTFQVGDAPSFEEALCAMVAAVTQSKAP